MPDAVAVLMQSSEFTDADAIAALVLDRDAGTAWTALELKYNLKPNNGMNAFRVYHKAKGTLPPPTPSPEPKPEPAPKPEPKRDDAIHPEWQTVCDIISVGEHAMLVGPAGSGKTTAAKLIAKKLGLEFRPMSVGSQTTMSHLFGFIDANGRYIATDFRKAYELGGLFLLDEVDAGNPNVLVALNAALSGEEAGFPDKVIQRHKDFRCIAAANTWGDGASREYVGRNQLDAATLDRFCKVVWNYDPRFELAISPNKQWTKRVQAIRAAVYALKKKVMVSPRSSLRGAKLLALGWTPERVEDVCIWNATDKQTKDAVLEYMKNH